MILNTQQYDITLEYCPGKEMHIADLLSRVHLKNTEGGNVFDYVNAVGFLPIWEEWLKKIQQATLEDEVMQTPTGVILNGWLDDKRNVRQETDAHFHCRDDMVVHDWLMLKGERVVIPHKLRPEIKQTMHTLE